TPSFCSHGILDTRSVYALQAPSVWEISIKHALGKLTLPEKPACFSSPRLAAQGIESLAVQLTHAVHAAQLPPVHRDPFDRMLVAQAQVEGLTLLSRDSRVHAYDVAQLG
ncbi:MAG: type II toxin-antitoxin system VapC family toxin, partial [Polyangiales bacterium]